jgi:anti-sigma-K factor RskA
VNLEALRHRLPGWRRLAAAAAVAAAAAAGVALLLPAPAGTHDFTLRTPSGRSVGSAELGQFGARNVSLSLVARGLPVLQGRVFVLWAGDEDRAVLQVGRFVVDRKGRGLARFNIPATQSWGRFWVTRPGRGQAVVARTA